MKKKKNDVAELKNLTIEEMKKINGGVTLIFTLPDGQKVKIIV